MHRKLTFNFLIGYIETYFLFNSKKFQKRKILSHVILSHVFKKKSCLIIHMTYEKYFYILLLNCYLLNMCFVLLFTHVFVFVYIGIFFDLLFGLMRSLIHAYNIWLKITHCSLSISFARVQLLLQLYFNK